MKNMSKALTAKIAIALVIISFFILLSKRAELSCFLTKYQLSHSNIELTQSDSSLFMKQFTQINTNEVFEFTLIEFGANACVPCRKMDTVLVEIKEIYGNKINIHFLNVREEKGKKAAKYFGVHAIPVQIILDRKGKEVFRHIGFYSTKNLQNEITKAIK